MNDHYLKDTPGLSDPANTMILLAQDDANDIAVGIKALRIFNTTAAVATIVVTTVLGDVVTFKVPASALVVEPLRIKRLMTATTDGVEVHGYTDFDQ
jgi:hypothetical protein